MGQSIVSLLIFGKYYIFTSNVGSYLYISETVLICTRMFPLPYHPLRTKYWLFSGFGIPLSLTNFNFRFYTFLYVIILIKMKIELIINNCFYYPFNLTCLITMQHIEFSKCRMIRTIEVWTKVIAIKWISLYNNRLYIIIWLLITFEMTNTYLCSTNYMQEYSIEVYSDWNSTSINYLSLVTCNHLSHHMYMYMITLHHHF